MWCLGVGPPDREIEVAGLGVDQSVAGEIEQQYAVRSDVAGGPAQSGIDLLRAAGLVKDLGVAGRYAPVPPALQDGDQVDDIAAGRWQRFQGVVRLHGDEHRLGLVGIREFVHVPALRPELPAAAGGR